MPLPVPSGPPGSPASPHPLAGLGNVSRIRTLFRNSVFSPDPICRGCRKLGSPPRSPAGFGTPDSWPPCHLPNQFDGIFRPPWPLFLQLLAPMRLAESLLLAWQVVVFFLGLKFN